MVEMGQFYLFAMQIDHVCLVVNKFGIYLLCCRIWSHGLKFPIGENHFPVPVLSYLLMEVQKLDFAKNLSSLVTVFLFELHSKIS